MRRARVVFFVTPFRAVATLLVAIALGSSGRLIAQPPQGPPGGGGRGGVSPGQRGLAPGQQNGPIPPRGVRGGEAPRGNSTLRGFVVAADTGSPIRRAQVRISGQGAGGRLATTDEQGRFEFKELPAGRFTLTASKGGFVTLQYGQRRPSEAGTPVDVGTNQVVEKIVIGLPRGSVITGRITDEFGEPVANAIVTAMRYGYSAGARRLLPGGGNSRDTTDDQGHFRLFGLTPGDYVISAAFRAGGDVTDPAGEPSGYAPTYYPGTLSAAEAQRVTVAMAQEQTGVAFSLIATPLVRVTGAAISSQGIPVTNGVVVLTPSNAIIGGGGMMQAANGRLDASGQFRISNVAPGRYVAHVRTIGGGPGGAGPFGGRGGAGLRGGAGADPFAEFGRQELTVGADNLDGVVIVTGPGARVIGQITTDASVPPSIRPQQVQVNARLAQPGEQAMPGVGGNARVNADWSFEITGLSDPRLFRVGVPQGWTLKSVLLAGQDITDVPLDFAPGQTVTGLQIVLSEKISNLSGLVTDTAGAAVTDVTIVVFPDDESRWMYQSRFVRTARPDQDGRYQITELPASDGYLIVPVQGLEDGQAGDPEFLARIRKQGVSFSLNDGETRGLDLRYDAR